MFCIQCAALNPPAAARCTGCGALLTGPSSSQAPPAVPSRQSRLLALPAVVVLFLILVLGWQRWTAHQARSSAYDRAAANLALGDLPEAIVWFGHAGGYRDAPEQKGLAEQRLATLQSALLDARSSLDRGDSQRAIELLRPLAAELPGNQQIVDVLSTAEHRFRAGLVRSRSVAIAGQDWLEAERLTLQLAWWDGIAPDSDALSDMRLQHAPLLFVRDGALFRIGPDLAGERRIFDELPVSNPEWSPDRSSISFFVRSADSETARALYIIDSNGTHPTLVDERALDFHPSWNPMQDELAYIAPAAPGPDAQGSVLRLFDRATGSTRTVASPPGFDRIISPTWSGDGQQLAAIALGGNDAVAVLVIDTATLNVRVLAVTVPVATRAVSWSPSADVLLLWTSPGASEWNGANGSTIVLLSIDDLVMTPVTPATQAPSRPVWAPDGRHFAYIDRGSTLHVRVRDGIGDRGIGLPRAGDGAITWGPGGIGILIPGRESTDPPMLVPLGERLGPVTSLSRSPGDGAPISGVRWGPLTEPAPERYDPLRTSE